MIDGMKTKRLLCHFIRNRCDTTCDVFYLHQVHQTGVTVYMPVGLSSGGDMFTEVNWSRSAGVSFAWKTLRLKSRNTDSLLGSLICCYISFQFALCLNQHYYMKLLAKHLYNITSFPDRGHLWWIKSLHLRHFLRKSGKEWISDNPETPVFLVIWSDVSSFFVPSHSSD